MSSNPFLDPESEFDYDLKIKDVKLEDKVKTAIPEPAKKSSQTAKTGFSIEDLADCYKITGVQYESDFLAVDFSKELLTAKNQNGHIEHAKNASVNDFVAPSALLLYSVCRTLWEHRDDSQYKAVIESWKEKVGKVFAEKWVHTLTRVNYKSQGTDTVVHNVGITKEKPMVQEIAGNNEWVKDSIDKSVYSALLGSDDVKEINDVYQWITGKDSRLWRISKPGTDCERAVVLGGVSGGFYVGASDVIDGGWPAFGVRRAKNF